MVGILVFFWDCLFSGAFAVSFRECIFLVFLKSIHLDFSNWLPVLFCLLVTIPHHECHTFDSCPRRDDGRISKKELEDVLSSQEAPEKFSEKMVTWFGVWWSR